MEICFVWRNEGELRAWVDLPFHESDAIPMNFKCLGQTQAVCTRRQLSFQIDQDRLAFSGGGSHDNVDSFPNSRTSFSFKNRERKGDGRVMRSGDIRHASTEAKPAIHDENKRSA